MKEMINEVWAQYKAARKIEDKESRTISPVIEAAFGAMDEADYEIEKGGEMSEASAGKLDDAYNELYHECVRQVCFVQDHPLWIACHALERAMVKYGLLEPDEDEEEPDERRNGSGHYDEYLDACDRAYEAWRDDGIMVSVPAYRPMEEEW